MLQQDNISLVRLNVFMFLLEISCPRHCAVESYQGNTHIAPLAIVTNEVNRNIAMSLGVGELLSVHQGKEATILHGQFACQPFFECTR